MDSEKSEFYSFLWTPIIPVLKSPILHKYTRHSVRDDLKDRPGKKTVPYLHTYLTRSKYSIFNTTWS